MVTLASLVAVAAMIAAFLAAALLLARRPASWDEERAVEEEPYLPRPRAPGCRGRCPLIALVGLEPGAGASSLAFNLAVCLAVEGRPSEEGLAARQPRPLCLLSEGTLSSALGLGPEPLRHLGAVGEGPAVTG